MTIDSGSDVTVEIQALSAEGYGIGPITAPPGDNLGKRVLVPQSVPGEIVSIEIVKEEQSLAHGILKKIISQSSDRRVPPCQYVPKCGGCSLQHMDIQKQRNEKLRLVQSLLARQAKIEPTTGYSMLAADLPEFHYRNRIWLHLNLNGELGFYKTGTGDVVDIQACLLAEQMLNDLLIQVRSFTQSLAKNVAAIKIERREQGLFILLKPRIRGTDLQSEINSLKDISATILHDEQDDTDAGHFAQVNTSANTALITYVTEQFEKSSKKAITEFYAGAGNFTFPLLKAGFSITAVEIDGHLTKTAQEMARTQGVESQVTFITTSCEKFCKDPRTTYAPQVLLDPPRAGARAVAEALSTDSVKKIIYVSCNPATLARDLKILITKGFVLEHVAVLDMFSQTAHVETISTLIAL